MAIVLDIQNGLHYKNVTPKKTHTIGDPSTGFAQGAQIGKEAFPPSQQHKAREMKPGKTVK
jgi:hypothetical protein